MASRIYDERAKFMQRGVPPEVLAVSPVSAQPRHTARGVSLPLNIIAVIISHVEDTGDIARITRTCRLMHYMTLPQLYHRVTLRSYTEQRYIDGKPEGYGGGSPFTTALSGLTTNNSATLVQEFCIQGSWPEPRMEDYTKGKVPDSTMLLNIALRAAVDKMINMKSFSWALNSKPLKTVYQGLAARTSLVSLKLKCPSSRAPRSIITLPPIPNLRKLCITDIDPLCYPDDISLLLLHSKKLEDLRLQWSPRMREEAEPSINLRADFGKCFEAKYRLPLKHLGLQNFYGVNTGDLKHIADPETIRSFDCINCFGGSSTGLSGPATVFLDETWKAIPEALYFRNFKCTRSSEPSEQHAKILNCFSGMEELYFVGIDDGKPEPECGDHRTPATENGTPHSTVSTPGSRTAEQASAALCKQYLHALATHHGSSMKKLLLPNTWSLSGEQIGQLVLSCPNLEELGLGLSDEEPNAIRILAPFLKNVRVLRILQNPWLDKAIRDDAELAAILDLGCPEPQLWKIPPSTQIKWAGIGDNVFRIGGTIQVPDEDGRMEFRKEVWRATLDDVKHIDIWKMDSLEI